MNVTDQRALGADLLAIIRRDKARRSRRDKLGKFFGALLQALITGFLTALLCGWMFMLAVDVIHSEWLPQVPTLGYWWAVLIAWLLRSSLSTAASAKSERAK